MGLSTALELARAGAKVAIVDPQPAQDGHRKASWAAAGILVTRGATRPLSAFRRFYLHSIAAYPEWLADLEAQSGIKVPFTRGGDYQVFDRRTEAGDKAYREKVAQLIREEALPWQETAGLPPFLTPFSGIGFNGPKPSGDISTLYFPNEAYVQNRILLEALHQACLRHGVRFFASAESIARAQASGHFEQELNDGTRLSADRLLITAGPFSESWLKVLGWQSSLIPVRGQVALIKRPWADTSMVHVQEDLYLIPRGQDMIVGATTEPNAWSYAFDAMGHDTLQARLHALLPQVPFEPIEAWSGLRPRTRDRLPLMGPVPGHDGAWICTGHYKCGISMAPLAGQCMAALMKGSRAPFEIEAFDPARRNALRPLVVA